jgi:hypothetical protein
MPRRRGNRCAARAGGGDDGEGSLSVGLAPCRLGGHTAPGAEGAVFLRREAGGAFLPPLRPAPAPRPVVARDLAAMGPCLRPPPRP